MSKDNKNKKLLLGSALAGLMVAAPGLSVTVSSTPDSGKFFQTVKLEAGYRLAQAGEGEGGTGDKGTAEQDEEEKEEKKEEKKEGSKSCGAGSCGG